MVWAVRQFLVPFCLSVTHLLSSFGCRVNKYWVFAEEHWVRHSPKGWGAALTCSLFLPVAPLPQPHRESSFLQTEVEPVLFAVTGTLVWPSVAVCHLPPQESWPCKSWLATFVVVAKGSARRYFRLCCCTVLVIATDFCHYNAGPARDGA